MGFIDLEPSLGSKWVEMLKQMVPNLTRLHCIFNPTTAAGGGSYYMGSVDGTSLLEQVMSVHWVKADIAIASVAI